jgi:hypothetical protein
MTDLGEALSQDISYNSSAEISKVERSIRMRQERSEGWFESDEGGIGIPGEV